MSGSIKHPRKNKATFVRYWSEDHLLHNRERRLRRVFKNKPKEAEKAVAAWHKRYQALKKAKQ